MSSARLYLFDDRRARRWAPFTLTRPLGELLHGCLTLRERAEQVLGVPCAAHLSRTALIGFDEPDAAPAISLDDLPTDEHRVLLSSRAVLDFQPVTLPSQATTILVDGTVVGWVLPAGAPPPSCPPA